MKAFVVEHHGTDGLRAADVPEPEAGDGNVLVKVSAASINPLDTMVRNREFKRLLKYRPPSVLGHDVAGVVTGQSAGKGFPSVWTPNWTPPRDKRGASFVAAKAYRCNSPPATTRRTFAAIVRAGLSAADEQNPELSSTYRFATSCERPSGFSTLRAGSCPMTAVPHICEFVSMPMRSVKICG
jgi:hypothetical protein